MRIADFELGYSAADCLHIAGKIIAENQRKVEPSFTEG
jgi:hypothetical protein